MSSYNLNVKHQNNSNDVANFNLSEENHNNEKPNCKKDLIKNIKNSSLDASNEDALLKSSKDYDSENDENKQFARLMQIVRTLRSPDVGCAWDRKQTHQTMRKYLIEEAQEAVDAIDQKDPIAVCEELGDLIMVIAMHARIAEESGTFNMAEVLRKISEKLIRRHPHVFGNVERQISAEQVADMWQEIKAEEKRHRNSLAARMEEVAKLTSPLQVAMQIQANAASVGFDFPNFGEAVKKMIEEANELQDRHLVGDIVSLEAELGDLLFSIVNVARLLDIDPEDALRKANQKFIRRFSLLEKRLETIGGFSGRTIQELDALWDEIKSEEKK